MTVAQQDQNCIIEREDLLGSSNAPIGVIDSGYGGISVVNAIRAEMPWERISYFADTANCPYGTRDSQFVLERMLTITRDLVSQGIKLLVVACNTASAVGLEVLRQEFPIPVVGLEPAVKPAVAISRTRCICVVATPQTIVSKRLDDLIGRYAGGVTVYKEPAPDWVEIVESGRIDSDEVEALVAPVIESAIDRGCDVIVLGCTHFPLLKVVLERVAKGRVLFVDSGPAVAKRTVWLLRAGQLLSKGPPAFSAVQINSSGDADVVERQCRLLLHEAQWALQSL